MDSEKTKQELFRTPLACAMLSGVLAVAGAQAFGLLFMYVYALLPHSRYASAPPSYLAELQRMVELTILLHGPAIYFRQWSRSAKAVPVTLLIQFFIGAGGAAITHNYLLQRIVTGAARGAMLGVFLPDFYRVSGKLRLCSLLGTLGAIPGVLPLLLYRYGHFTNMKESIAFTFMSTVVAAVIQAVLPTIPVERTLHTAAGK